MYIACRVGVTRGMVPRGRRKGVNASVRTVQPSSLYAASFVLLCAACVVVGLRLRPSAKAAELELESSAAGVELPAADASVAWAQTTPRCQQVPELPRQDMLPKANERVLRIERDTSWSNAHVVVHGALHIAPGARLTLDHTVLEVVSVEAAEAGLVIAKGAELRAIESFVGGNQRQAAAVHVHGTLRALRSCVQHAEGVHVFDGSVDAETLGRGTNAGHLLLKGGAAKTSGPAPVARVKLVDSDLSLGLFFDASRAAGAVALTLPKGRASGMLGTDLPGAMFAVEFERSSVPLWLLFFSGVREAGAQAPVTYRLKESSMVLPNIIIDASVERPFLGALDLVPHGAVLGAFGHVTLSRELPLDGENALSWGLSLSGPGARASVSGRARVGSVLLRDRAELALQGTTGTKELKLLAANVRVEGASRLFVKNATVAQDDAASPLGALLELKGAARAVFDRVDLGRLGVRQERAFQAGFIDARSLGGTALDLGGQPVPVPLRRGLELEQASSMRTDRLWAGVRLRVGAKPLVLSRLGRRTAAEPKASHRMVLLDESYAVIAETRVDGRTGAPDDDGVTYGPPTKHITLESGHVYYLLSDETEGAEPFVANVPSRPSAPLFQEARAVTMQSLETLPVYGAAGTAHAGVQLQVWDESLPVRR